jgi:hypothetical protein
MNSEEEMCSQIKGAVPLARKFVSAHGVSAAPRQKNSSSAAPRRQKSQLDQTSAWCLYARALTTWMKWRSYAKAE